MRKPNEKINNSSDGAVFSKKRKGFSLLEVIIAIFIFSLIMIAAVSVFVSAFHARIAARNSQKSLEEARTAMETVAKNIRMSTKVKSSNGQKTIQMFNNSQGECIAYQNSNGQLLGAKYDPDPNITTDPSYPNCGSIPSLDSVLLSSGADVTFNVTETNTTEGSEHIGRATIIMKIIKGSAVSNLQTTVSFRDYKDILYKE